MCASVVHSTVFSLVEAIFRHLGLAQSYKSTCMCPKYLYLRYSVEFTLLPSLAGAYKTWKSVGARKRSTTVTNARDQPSKLIS